MSVLRFVDGYIDGECLARLDMPFRGIEVRVSGDDLPGFHEVREKHILSRTTLVGRDNVVEARQARDGLFQFEERACAGVTLIAHHQRCPLAVGHSAGAGVGQQVDVHLLGTEHKHIVLGSCEPLFALCACGFADGLYHLNLPRFCKR